MRRESGMTLVEVMISAVVLSLVMLALSASLRMFATTYTAVEQSADRTARLREVSYFLRHVLREAYSPYSGTLHVAPNEISWLAPLDRVGAAAGLVWLRLRHAGDALMLDFAIPDGDAAERADTDPDWGGVVPSEMLIEGVKRFRVEVAADPGALETSDNDDSLNAELPPGVIVEWELEDGPWPPLVVAFDGYEMRR